MNTIGIDFGLSRIGIARSQGQLAEPIGTYQAITHKQRERIIIDIILPDEPTLVVIGTTASTITPNLLKFITLLKRYYFGKIEMTEEAMTTIEAQQHALASSINRKKRQANIDAYAATIILQTYLDETTNQT